MARGEGRRIHHTKSRNGCLRCKARKVKCDEIRPRCGNCIKYETTCQYAKGSPAESSSLSLPSSLSTEPARRTTTPSSTESTPREVGPTRSRDALLELQLMHHYSSVTSQDAFMANHDPRVKDIYIRLAPILALSNESLLNALLAAAALHMYKLDPEKTDFIEVHRRYFDACIADQREAVNRINAQNADALCIAASFISFQALCMRPESQTYTPPSMWLDLATGNAAVFAAAWEFVKESDQIMAIVDAEPNLRLFREKCWQEYPDIFPDDLERIFPALLSFQDPSENLDADLISVYKWSMGYVGHSLMWIEAKEDPSKIRRLLSAFGAMAPPTFKVLVRMRQARALVILAHFFAILKAVDDVWWLRGVAEREVFGIQGLIPERWQWAMAWPMRKISFYAAAAITSREME